MVRAVKSSLDTFVIDAPIWIAWRTLAYTERDAARFYETGLEIRKSFLEYLIMRSLTLSLAQFMLDFPYRPAST